MTDLADIIARASAHGLLLSAHADGTQLRVKSVTRAPVPDAFRDELLAAKPDLLTHLARRDEALAIVCATMDRLADVYPIGCPTGSREWREADDAITNAYWYATVDVLRRVCDRYEALAMQRFAQYRAGLKPKGGAG